MKSIAYGEAHAIVTLLTPGGIVAVMARGAKKPQSRLRAGIGPCVKGIYSIYKRSGMGNLQQVEVVEIHKRFREYVELAAFAAYFCELAQSVADEPSVGSESLYRMVEQLLFRLHENPKEANVLARIWEAKVLSILGAAPDWNKCVRCNHPVEKPNLYSLVDGGFICATCGERGKDTFSNVLRVVPQTSYILHKFTIIPFTRLGHVTLSLSTQSSLKAVLANQLSEFAGLSLKSRGVLESLDMEPFFGEKNPEDR